MDLLVQAVDRPIRRRLPPLVSGAPQAKPAAQHHVHDVLPFGSHPRVQFYILDTELRP